MLVCDRCGTHQTELPYANTCPVCSVTFTHLQFVTDIATRTAYVRGLVIEPEPDSWERRMSQRSAERGRRHG